MEAAWAAAQTRLAEIRALGLGSGPSKRTIRVGQLDAELLDQELVQLLQEPVAKALNSPRWTPELSLFIRMMLYKLSVWDSGATYGAKLQDLRYTIPRSPSRLALSPSGLPRRTLLIHAFLTVIVPYFHTRIRSHALSRAWPDAPSSDRRRKIWDILVSLESVHALVALLSFVAFLWDGRFRTVTDRLLKMRLTPSRKLIKRDVSYEFMNRQMVWHAFTEFLLFLLPLLNAKSLRRRLSRLKTTLTPSFLRGTTESKLKTTRGKYWSLPQDQCAICAENASFNLNLADPTNALTSLTTSVGPSEDGEPPLYPIYTPYVASCGDVFCYHCIAERIMRAADEEDGQKWECLRCGQPVESADRLIVEPTGSDHELSDYDFSSDITDLSSSMVSMGSYSESVLSES
ncbi:hypothetical protein MIND_00744900 [Mycena indigotica]|uniref:RING-type E3 ubiquitin transferase (cysteine targeting) n=1 Tax=Mycena indigotica TaxID=2126181 RepID=A0A8H6SMZ9_9AGAR|nr:uncharacterized protein MIND_00744900 [Mycena indigotica]KAF7301792.1 hypothetical protein MIND_00744900 [Mycena indigotica]